MGNIGSQIASNSHKYNLESPIGVYHQQHLSLPRVNQHQQHQYQQKILPVSKEQRSKLRSTENGKILHSGGTLSGRHQESKVPRGTVLNVREKVNLLKELQENRTEKMKRAGSEPDLRHRLSQEMSKPICVMAEPMKSYDDWLIRRRSSQSNRDSDRQDSGSSNNRRIGLFKSRMEKNNRLINKNKNASDPIIRNNCVWEEKNDVGRLQSKDVMDDSTKGFYNNKCDVHNQHVSNDESNVKKYYFGMENTNENCLNYEISNYVKSSDISDELLSNISSNLDYPPDANHSQDIVLNLRPILPKKRLEIPKFSSSVAWKLLYSVDTDQNLDRGSTNVHENDRFLCEERISPFSPSRCSKSLEFQFSQDKSGDSGISGDETPKPATTWGHYYKNKQSWTPQEDLGDEDTTTDDDEEDGRIFNSVPYRGGNNLNKPHIFSLSLPRDHFSNQCALEKYKNQLKRSASGIFSSSDEFEGGNVENRIFKNNSNWLLSKSAPNSLSNVPLDNGHSSPMAMQSHNNNNHQQATGRIMYLPSGDEEYCIQVEVGEDASRRAIEETEKRERERLREIEAMQRIEEEFKKKRARQNGLYSNNQHQFRKVLLSTGEKSV